MRQIFLTILRSLARAILLRHHPDIIAITGSVGKSSTREAIFCVLKNQLNVRQSEKNYNNEIGLPLAIIGSKSQGKSILGWLIIILKAIILLVFKSKNYPKILILELGADKPGDIAYLLKIIPQKLLKVGIVTAVGSTHLEAFKTVEKVLAEKKTLLLVVRQNGWAIINNDDDFVDELKKNLKSKIMTYGLNPGADVIAKEIKLSPEKGLTFKLSNGSGVLPASLPDGLGYHQLYPALAAAAVGLAFDVTLVHISEALKNFASLPGRMRLLDGIKKTKIIDDTYNSSPLAATAAIKTLGQLDSNGSKWAVLGDMLELGRLSEEEHRRLGREVAKAKIDYLVTVGERARDIARGARKVSMDKDHVFEFADTMSAGIFIQNRLAPGDLLLIKGSQGIRMERVVKELMAEPEHSSELLVRQDKEWLVKK